MNWKTQLKTQGYLVTDGAMGTQLTLRGLPAGAPPEVWNLEQPDAVADVSRAYVEAGARIVLTNTLGGTRWKLDRAGLGDRTVEVNRAAADAARRGAGEAAAVFVSVGPTGEMVAPLGARGEEEFVEVFAEQIAAGAAAGADGVCIETMTALEEALAAVRAARQAAPDLPVVASMTFEAGAKVTATVMGVTPAQAARALEEAGADAVGSNCGDGIAGHVEVAAMLRPATRRPVWIKSNAGRPEYVDGQTVFRQTPEDMAGHVEALLAAGANLIGGCCGTTPEHIRAIAEAAEAARDTALQASREVLEGL
jgi:5-methyltetrahydrofolate--homocysteine methyltransferase